MNMTTIDYCTMRTAKNTLFLPMTFFMLVKIKMYNQNMIFFYNHYNNTASIYFQYFIIIYIPV